MCISTFDKPILCATLPSPLLALPLELQFLIIPHLSYPDALALKHTHPHFYSIVNTSVRLKVAWLLERKERRLEWPQKMCAMKTDAAFCGGNGEVRIIMERRRAHAECADGEGGCEVLVGSTCGGAKAKGRRRAARGIWNNNMEGSESLARVWIVGLLVTSFLANLFFVLRWISSQR